MDAICSGIAVSLLGILIRMSQNFSGWYDSPRDAAAVAASGQAYLVRDLLRYHWDRVSE
jgi:hypothetical protein